MTMPTVLTLKVLLNANVILGILEMVSIVPVRESFFNDDTVFALSL